MPSDRDAPRGSGNRHRVVFMGTPEFAVPTLDRLIRQHDVVGVFTQPDRPSGRGRQVVPSPVKALATEHAIPIFQPTSFRKEPDAVEALRALAPKVVVVAAYGLILPQNVLDIPSHGTLNVHASLLPRWRGAAPVAHAILAGDDETGVTIMLVEAGLDTGPILTMSATPIGANETAGELTGRLAVSGAELLGTTLPRWVAGEVAALRQDDALATYAPRLAREDGRLDWLESAEALARRVRAMSPWPGAYATWNDQPLKVHAASVVDGTAELGEAPLIQAALSPAASAFPTADVASSPPPAALPEVGRVILQDRFPAVITGDGVLRLEVVQAPGAKALAGADFVRGRPGLVGARLG